MSTSRRSFLIAGLGAASSLAWRHKALADEAPKLDENDPQAQQLGYKQDATKVDVHRFPAYAAGQTCANCSLFEGKPGDVYGGCVIFGKKQVAAAGWCSSYTNS
jgi:High potential iron-sulfur protein